MRPNCTVPECHRPHRARGYCAAHYLRWQKHGDPGKGRITPRVPPAGLQIPEGSKWCPRCDAVKLLTAFQRNRASRDGRQSYCSVCLAAAKKKPPRPIPIYIPPAGSDLAWVAGLYEGEGSIVCTRVGQLRISLTSTDRDVLERLMQLCGGAIYDQKWSGAPDHYKQRWQWSLGRNYEVYILATAMLPLLLARRQQQVIAALSARVNGRDRHDERARSVPVV